MRKEWELIHCINPGDGARHCRSGIADVLCHRPRTERCLFEFSCDRCGGEIAVRLVLPLNLERLQAFSGRAHMVSYDSDRVVEPYDLADALHRASRDIVHVSQASAKHG